MNTLANSKTFQRFAIRSNAMFTDVAKKTVEGKQDIHQQSKEFLKVFREEVRALTRELLASHTHAV